MRLEFRDIHKSFGENHVLKGISLFAESGKAVGLLGRNGAGKTTSIRILMGVFSQDSGEILLDGKPINRKTVKFGYLPEERGLYPKKKISDQLVYFGELKGMSRRDALNSADKWLLDLSMSEYRLKRLDTLSKGNQQKIQLISALITDPDIVVLDEPFSGLDPVNAKLLEDAIKRVISEGKIVFFSSHQMNYIEEFCSDIAILNNGKIALFGNLNEIKRSYDRTRIIIKTEQPDIVLSAVDGAKLFDDHVEVKIQNTDEKQKLLEKLSQSGADIDSVSVWEPTLNDIFVEYTREETV